MLTTGLSIIVGQVKIGDLGLAAIIHGTPFSVHPTTL
jgi:hypothetical protein